MNLPRDQQRARHAYERVAAITGKAGSSIEAYKIAVESFGARVIQGGLRAAVAWLQRGGVEAGPDFLEDLATANLRGIGARQRADEFVAAVEAATTADYMLATRDAIAVVAWFRRAVQAARINGKEEAK